MFLQNLKIDFNKNFVNFSATTEDHLDTGTHFNLTFDLFSVVDRLNLSLKINVQENEYDDKYRKQIARTSVDMAKLFKDMRSNFILKTIGKDLVSTLDFDPKFPWQKVKKNNC